MSERIVWMFSGQGSQYYNMGSELYDGHPVFRRWMNKFDAIAREKSGSSLLEVLYDARRDLSDVFDDLQITHPALFMLQYSLAMTLWEEGVRPDLLVGASLGEFVASSVGGAAPPEPLFEALLEQARRVKDLCSEGGMLAVLETPEFFHKNREIFSGLELASVNFHKHFVVAGGKESVEAVEKNLAARGVSHIRLPVRQGFHSSSVDPVKGDFLEAMSSAVFLDPLTPILSCMTAGPMARPSADFYWNVIRRPFDFREAFRAMKDDPNTVYVDLGPSGVLANFVKYLSPGEAGARVFPILSPFRGERRRYDRALARLKEPPRSMERSKFSGYEYGIPTTPAPVRLPEESLVGRFLAEFPLTRSEGGPQL